MIGDKVFSVSFTNKNGYSFMDEPMDYDSAMMIISDDDFELHHIALIPPIQELFFAAERKYKRQTGDVIRFAR